MTAYEDYQLALGPPWLQTPSAEAYQRAHGAAKDALVTAVVAAVEARMIQTADEEALLERGTERGLRRYPGEYLEAYRRRVLGAWEFWQQAGTVPGLLLALEHMGYGVAVAQIDNGAVNGIFQSDSPGGVTLTQAGGGEVQDGSLTVTVDGEDFTLPTLIVPDDYRFFAFPPTRIIEHWREDRSIWAEFSVYLTPTDPSLNADAWDDGSRWDDGSLWNLSITQQEVDRVVAVLNEVKPAHTRLRGVYLVSQFRTDYWDDGSRWDDGSVWDADQPITLYLRPGA